MIKILESVLRENEDRPVIQDARRGRELTGSQVLLEIGRSCGFWRRFFPDSGHHVGILAENSADWLIQLFGIIASGNLAVAYHSGLSEDEIRHQMRCSNTEVMLCDDGMYFNGMISDGISSGDGAEPCDIRFVEMSEAWGGDAAEFAFREDDEDVLLLFSSGTGGRSKIVSLTNGNLSAFAQYLRDAWKGFETSKTGTRDTVLVPVPLYHISGIFNCYNELIRGNSLIISGAKYLFRDAAGGGATKAVLVPSMLRLLADRADRDERLGRGVRTLREVVCLGAALPSELAEFLLKRGIRLTIYYGLTETAGIVSGLGDYREGASGQLVPYMEAKLLDGELLLRGPNVMKGYYKNPQETAQVLQDGWLYTGDLAEIREGYLYIRGRKKNIIILDNGENVSPEELEEKLYACPLITECLVWEEEGQVAADVYSAGEDTDWAERKEQIESYVRKMNQTLPPTHRIVRLHIRQEELEKTASGKIKRKRTLT